LGPAAQAHKRASTICSSAPGGKHPEVSSQKLAASSQPASQSAKAGLGLGLRSGSGSGPGPSPAVGELMAEQCSNSWRSSSSSSSSRRSDHSNLAVRSPEQRQETDAGDAGHEFMSPRPCLQMRSRRDQGRHGWCPSPWMEVAAIHAHPHAASPLLSCDPSPYSIKCPTWDWAPRPWPASTRCLARRREVSKRHLARPPRLPTTRSTGGWSLAWATAPRRQRSTAQRSA
jgi:hypothetical protein